MNAAPAAVPDAVLAVRHREPGELRAARVSHLIRPNNVQAKQTEHRLRNLCRRSTRAGAEVVWATHAAPAADLFTQKVEGTAWKSKPSWYIVANNDRTVQSELQLFVAKRMGATTFETDGSHVPMRSQPALCST